MFKQCGAQISQAYKQHTGTWGGFEISFTEYFKMISIITLPSHRRRDKKSQITPLELSELRAWNGQLLWLVCNVCHNCWHLCRCWWDKHLKLQWARFMRRTNWLGRRLRGHGHHSKSMLIILLLWLRTQMLDGPRTSQGGQLVFIANSDLLQGRDSNISLISWHSSRLRRVARSSSAAETQAAAEGDDELVYIR